LLVRGQFKKGGPVGLWSHYFLSGTLKSTHDLNAKHFKEYTAGGLVTLDKKEYADSTVVLIYSPSENNELRIKNVFIPNRQGRITVFTEYYPNGNLKQLETRQDTLFKTGSSPLGKTGPYREGYENGRVKLMGQYRNNRRVGTWIWYHEDGSEMTRVDYREGEFGQ
jgi:uncharacterized protein